MALLTATTFRVLFDVERINDLASLYDESIGGLRYDESIITTLIDQADTRIKGALNKMYTTAEIEADASLQRMCGDMTMTYLELRRGQIPSDLQRIYNDHLDRLRRLQAGDEKLAAVAELLPSMTIHSPLDRNLYGEDTYFDGISAVEDEEV